MGLWLHIWNLDGSDHRTGRHASVADALVAWRSRGGRKVIGMLSAVETWDAVPPTRPEAARSRLLATVGIVEAMPGALKVEELPGHLRSDLMVAVLGPGRATDVPPGKRRGPLPGQASSADRYTVRDPGPPVFRLDYAEGIGDLPLDGVLSKGVARRLAASGHHHVSDILGMDERTFMEAAGKVTILRRVRQALDRASASLTGAEAAPEPPLEPAGSGEGALTAEDVEAAYARFLQTPLLATLREALSRLDERGAGIVGARLGVDGRPRTLESVARTAGVTTQRVSQIERRFIDRNCPSTGWPALLRRRLSQGPVPLDALTAEPWATGMGRLSTLRVLQATAGQGASVAVVDGIELVGPVTARRWQEVVREAAAASAGLERDAAAAREALLGCLAAGEAGYGPWLLREAGCPAAGTGPWVPSGRLSRSLDETLAGILRSLGRPATHDEVLALLPEPHPSHRVLARTLDASFRRMPGGLHWLRETAAPDGAIEALGEACERVLRDAPHGRPMRPREILDAAEAAGLVPHGHDVDDVTASLLSRPGVARQPWGRWALAGSRAPSPKDLRDLLLATGGPMTADEIRARLPGVSLVRQDVSRPETLYLGRDRWGLAARDLPGTEAEREDAVAAAFLALGKGPMTLSGLRRHLAATGHGACAADDAALEATLRAAREFRVYENGRVRIRGNGRPKGACRVAVAGRLAAAGPGGVTYEELVAQVGRELGGTPDLVTFEAALQREGVPAGGMPVRYVSAERASARAG